MKIPKKLIAVIIGTAGSAAPLVSDVISEKMKQNSEGKFLKKEVKIWKRRFNIVI